MVKKIIELANKELPFLFRKNYKKKADENEQLKKLVMKITTCKRNSWFVWWQQLYKYKKAIERSNK